jgi:hypothetical protein
MPRPGDGLADVDVYDDGGFLDFGFQQAPGAVPVLAAVWEAGPIPATGLATRRQLRAMGLSPGGHETRRRHHLAPGRPLGLAVSRRPGCGRTPPTTSCANCAQTSP